jgi:hypothetical protein
MHVCSQMLLTQINAMLQYQIKSNAIKELSGNVPITSSTLMWFTCPFLNGLGLAFSSGLFSRHQFA